MFNTVADLLGRSTAIISTIPALPVAFAAFKLRVGGIPKLATAQAQPTTGVTTDKATALQAMGGAAVSVASGVFSYANNKKLGDLAAKVDVTPSDFVTGREQSRVNLAQQIHDAAAGVLAELAAFAVTAADLEDLQKKIDAARDALNAPRAVANVKKSATKQLPDVFRAADDLLQKEIDPLVAKLAPDNADFYAKYQAARIIVERPGGHASPADGSATPAAPPNAPANGNATPPAAATPPAK